MTTLNDYIGSIVSSITNARVMSDLQTVKVAEEYAKHSLLQHFSVPRMRIGDIEMTIPVALEEVMQKTNSEFEPIDNLRFNRTAYKEIVNGFGLGKFPASMSKDLQSIIANNSKDLEEQIRLANNRDPIFAYSKKMIFHAKELVQKNDVVPKANLEKIDFEEMAKKLVSTLAKEIKVSNENQVIDRLHLIVEASKLREQKPENLIYIKLKITEDGMEWNKSETKDGQIESRLIPE